MGDWNEELERNPAPSFTLQFPSREERREYRREQRRDFREGRETTRAYPEPIAVRGSFTRSSLTIDRLANERFYGRDLNIRREKNNRIERLTNSKFCEGCRIYKTSTKHWVTIGCGHTVCDQCKTNENKCKRCLRE